MSKRLQGKQTPFVRSGPPRRISSCADCRARVSARQLDLRPISAPGRTVLGPLHTRAGGKNHAVCRRKRNHGIEKIVATIFSNELEARLDPYRTACRDLADEARGGGEPHQLCERA